MCIHCSASAVGPSRRHVLAGLAALSVAGTGLGAHAAPPACLGAVAPASDAERVARWPTKADAFAEPLPAARGAPVTAALSGPIRRVDLPADRKLVALTFDLCETSGSIAGYDGRVVDFLREQSVPATFFAGGLWLETHRRRATELVADPLFEIANHSWSHRVLHSAPAGTIDREILLTEAALEDMRRDAGRLCGVVGRAPAHRLFRFPFGSCSAEAAAAANAAGSVVIQWDVVSGDPDGTAAKTIVRAVLAGVRPGSIVVMHANGRGTHTAEALRIIVPALRARGLRPVTVDDLLAAGRPKSADACYIERSGDTARYDHPGAARSAPATAPRRVGGPGRLFKLR